MNKRVLESLIKAGALDSFGRRAQLMAAVGPGDGAGAEGSARSGEPASMDSCQLGNSSKTAAPRTHRQRMTLPNVPDWDENERLQAEKEVLGFFVSGHPLDKYAEKMRNLPAWSIPRRRLR